MKIVGLTGGIGSGKTTISDMFKKLGVPIYIADTEAKRLMNKSKTIRTKLIKLFGAEAYNDHGLNREFIASKIFNDKNLLEEINHIVHPEVAEHFSKWIKNQDAPYVIKEAAIIFENDMQNQFDFIITVVADKEARIERLLKRENISRERILSVMANQMSDDEKTDKSDFTIINNDLKRAEKSVLKIHKSLLQLCIK
ncbi:dephospho-CoA kinase [Flavobacteriaceae bacterium MAR_2010_188]|nr:dephospho-CoA kinase [Flavobacteriaceae bacterium MAR_2010_188]